MTVTEVEFPRPVGEMCADLAGQGFDVLHERLGASGDALLELQGPVNVDGRWLEGFVLVARERGRWSVAVRFEGMAGWLPVSTWLALLDGTGHGEPDLDRQARFVRYRLAEAGRLTRGQSS